MIGQSLGLEPLTLDVGFNWSASVAFDGKIVAYSSDRGSDGFPDIWIRHIDRPQPIRRTKDAGGGYMPTVSPDGSRIAYRSNREGGSRPAARGRETARGPRGAAFGSAQAREAPRHTRRPAAYRLPRATPVRSRLAFCQITTRV